MVFFVSAFLLLKVVLTGDTEGDLEEFEAKCALALVLMRSKEACLDGLAEDVGEGDGEEEAGSFVIDGFFFSLLFAFLTSKYRALSLSSFSFKFSRKSLVSSKVL